jgi:hypothetical protein
MSAIGDDLQHGVVTLTPTCRGKGLPAIIPRHSRPRIKCGTSQIGNPVYFVISRFQLEFTPFTVNPFRVNPYTDTGLE